MVIQAQFKRARTSRSRRGEVRRTMQLLAPGKTADGRIGEILIHDLSTSGLLLETEVSMAIGETIEVVLPRTGTRQAEVVWTSGSFFGCRFLEPVPPAAVSASLLKAAPPRSAALRDQHQEAPTEFGEKLSALRSAQGWTLETLADRLGVSRQAVWYWETGQRLPRAEHFQQIAKLFAVPESDLLAEPTRTETTGYSGLISQLKQEVARRNGVAEASVRIIVEF
jgi:transcriptional regulator with XRE-family HTH domain